MDADRLLGADERSRLLVRARDVFTTLQAAWSQQKLEGMRPFETDALFQAHRFWVLEYQRQRLKNQIDNVDVEAVELCRVQHDGAHVAATLRITASCIDTTVDASGKRISGNPRVPRRFSEYWTFVKHADAKGSSSLVNCPNCGAPLEVSQAGVCEHCQSKLTLGRFDWVASRIEQDEDISGA
jgi:predicted lipid-binding transport protein (Tim44 family)